ncbi:hypothetical protein MTR_5g008990 [Medicago truncatula]|uniref:Uncharacterized protein n=1 Tax=Medicago truncatula TaxID=3880 RepID=G7K997_MEDTR|nr:hypothetical protein MTR_5g008990 [Medicago truncatula]
MAWFTVSREREKERAETATVAAYSCPYNASWLQLSPAVLTDAQLKEVERESGEEKKKG